MPNHIAWSSIELLHNVVLTLTLLNQRDGAPFPTVSYKGKVKLHGTNCSVQVTPEGIFAQSKEKLLTPKDDYKGFAKWMETHKAQFEKVECPKVGCTIYGEWAGKGIEDGMAVSTQDKIWAVFAIQDGYLDEAVIVYEPEAIRARLRALSIPNMYVLPWHMNMFQMNYGDKESMAITAEKVNEHVLLVENEDPWVKEVFGVSGMGEGIVFYPIVSNTEPTAYAQLMWKAKGAKHRTANAKVAAQVDPDVVQNVSEFVALMVAEARLSQGVKMAADGKYEKRYTGKFVQWVTDDTEKESKAELEASNLEWGKVKGAVSAKAREWYLAKAS